MSKPPQSIKIWCSFHGSIDNNIFTEEWLGKSYNSMKAQKIPNSNPEPSKQWSITALDIKLYCREQQPEPELANTQTNWNGTRIPKINPGLYSQMILHQKNKNLYTGEKNTSPITVAPRLKKKITQYLSLCT